MRTLTIAQTAEGTLSRVSVSIPQMTGSAIPHLSSTLKRALEAPGLLLRGCANNRHSANDLPFEIRLDSRHISFRSRAVNLFMSPPRIDFFQPWQVCSRRRIAFLSPPAEQE